MSGSSHKPRLGVFILPGGQPTQKEHHWTQAILARNGSPAGVFHFPHYQALFDAASLGLLDAVICDNRAATERELYFVHLLGEVLWYRYRLRLHHLDAPQTDIVDPIYQQLLAQELVAAYSDPAIGVTQPQPFGYARVDGCQQIIATQSEALADLIRGSMMSETSD